MPLVPYSDPGAVTAGDPLPAAYLNTTRANGAWFSEPPQCSVSNSTGQSVPHDTLTAMLCATESLDNNGMHSTTSNTSRITAIAAGRYTFTATAAYGVNATGMRQLVFRINGTTQHIMVYVAAVSALVDIYVSASRTFTLAANDYVEMMVYQNSGGALTCYALAFEAILVSTTPA